MTSDYRIALREFQDYVEDVRRARHLTFGDSLTRLLSVLDSTNPLGSVANRVLPNVNFDEWYKALMSQVSGMGGHGPLDWPSASDHRVALQLELLRQIASGPIDLFDFSRRFLGAGSRYDDMVSGFAEHVVRPFARDFLRLMHGQPEMQESHDDNRQKAAGPLPVFVDPSRVAELQDRVSTVYDLRKLVRLCQELNICYQQECYFAVATLTRALLDHVPPLFGCRTFLEVVSNHPWGRSRKDAMVHLQNSARRIADIHLHTPAGLSGDFAKFSASEFRPERRPTTWRDSSPAKASNCGCRWTYGDPMITHLLFTPSQAER